MVSGKRARVMVIAVVTGVLRFVSMHCVDSRLVPGIVQGSKGDRKKTYNAGETKLFQEEGSWNQARGYFADIAVQR
jgi:hypothetical protein